MILFRKISFWIALAGIGFAAMLVVRLRAGLTEPVLPPPVAPPAKPFTSGIAASGLIEAQHENTNVGVPISGLVTRVHVRVWDRVETGAPLLQLDDRELQASLLTQKANVAIAAATLQKARAPLARIQTLHKTGVASDDDYDARVNDVAVAEAQLAATQAIVKQTETLIERLTVRAPTKGTILQVNMRAGEYANVLSATPSVVLGNIDEVQLRADVDEQTAPRVKAGKKAIGYLKGDTERPIQMEFVRIEPFVIPKRSLTGGSMERVDTRVLQVIFRFTNDPLHPVYVGQQMDLYIEQ
ncbi:efflux RND transporter periplasmic adaptor subunit [Oleiharenicola lentus]|uniref:efflux RND transporter periplasmic adaptor subunit n=1 Tax=Oleiharenicola lentus TaxID=2508720 RepID=UPI003F66E900